ncbi:hypothetical protein N7510_006785 [Penicillium lagena]|uniref:uncharacterized protein n=1 Tax=Penicillium lagena TaxID=94218 RepID=UPI002540FD62|nr:uncharacterized protein N7510_006785 [Penicillium lagena]KAJ5610066.1 hypothetical protein N7510_006785 [Penicillium lagena]
MKFQSVTLVLAAAGIAAADIHAPHGHHGHLHHRKREVKTEVVPGPIVYEYELNGNLIPAEKACDGIADGLYKWADGVAPSDACVTSTVAPTTSTSTSTSTSTPTPTPTIKPAEFFEQSLSISSSSSTTTTSTSTLTPSTTSTTTSPAAPTSSLTGGGVTLVNNAGQPIYLWSVSDVPAEMVTIPAGGSYSENWRTNPDGGGISVKVSTSPSLDNILQYEYTLAGSTIFWDLSCINMLLHNLLSTVGFSVTSDNTDCVQDVCAAGDLQCAAAYLFPADNLATHGCDANTQMIFTIGL